MREFRFPKERFTFAAFPAPIPSHGRFVLDFGAEAKAGLPLHISLRMLDGKVVANDRIGESWGEEIVAEIDPSQVTPPIQIAVAFREKSARLILNGRTALRLNNARFDLSNINHVRLSEDVPLSDIVVNRRSITEQFYTSQLELTGDFMIEGRAFRPSSLGETLHLCVEGLDSRQTVWKTVSDQQVEGTTLEVAAISAALPGYVWLRAAEDPDRPLILQLYSGDHPIGEKLEIVRQDIIDRLEALAEKARPEDNIHAALTAVEHVKFAQILDLLPDRSANFIRRTVEVFNLAEFLDPGAAEPAAANAPQREPERPSFLTAMQKKFATVARQNPEAGLAGHLSQLGGLLIGSNRSSGQFLISLSEYCCVKGEFDTLFQKWMQFFGIDSLPKPTNNWTRSLLLPFHLRLGQFAEVATLLKDLSKHPDDWVNTGCVAWTIEKSLDDVHLAIGSAALSSIVDAFLQFTTVHAKGYWTRSPCRNLIRATALLVILRDQLPEPAPSDIVRSVLRNYGLSRDFWETLDAALAERVSTVTDLGPEIAAGHAAFCTVRASVEQADTAAEPTRAATEAALRFFQNIGTYDAARIRMEVFGPDNLISDGETGLGDLIEQGNNAAEILIRHLAFPGARHLSPKLASFSRQAIRQRLHGISQTRHHANVEAISADCNALCRSVQSGQTTGSELETLQGIMRRLQRLPVAPESRLDLGIALALCGDFLRDGRTDLADVLSSYLFREIEALPQAAAKAVRSNRMIRGTLPRFRLLAAASASPLAMALDTLLQEKIKLTQQPPATPDPAMTRLWIDSRGLFDTLVLVYSCRANLDTKVAQARRTWLRRLAEYGIPYLVVVGGGTGTIEGDVLSVDAPDTYEALPQKTLAMLIWAETQTHFAHVLKIDDDCFLGVREYFCSLSHRQSNYYGRTLTRNIGDKPRMWHMSRSASFRGQNELDKSPEPSRFADGGSAYALSREALAAISNALTTPAGQHLSACSYSEDKLVGDLLNTARIQCRSDDYHVAVRRATRPDGLPVLQWENTFYPSLMSGIKLAHLDTFPDLEICEQHYSLGTLHPKKLWPTHSPLALRNTSQTMELISPEARLKHAKEAEVAVVAVVRNEMYMLPHFLKHYRDQGVDAFLVVDNCSDDGTLEFLLDQPDVTVFSADGAFRQAAQGTDWKIAMMAQFRVGKWTLVADSDELLVYRGYETRPLADYLHDPIHGNADAFLTSMIDMFPKGSLSEATFAKDGPFIEAGYAERDALLDTSLSFGSFGNRPARTSSLRHRLIAGSRPELFVSEKVAMVKYKPWMRFSVSMHYAAGLKLADQNMILAHFKYNSEFRSKADREIKRGQYFNNSEEYKKYVDLISEGRDVIYDPETSVPWRDCREVRAVLGR